MGGGPIVDLAALRCFLEVCKFSSPSFPIYSIKFQTFPEHSEKSSLKVAGKCRCPPFPSRPASLAHAPFFGAGGFEARGPSLDGDGMAGPVIPRVVFSADLREVELAVTARTLAAPSPLGRGGPRKM